MERGAQQHAQAQAQHLHRTQREGRRLDDGAAALRKTEAFGRF